MYTLYRIGDICVMWLVWKKCLPVKKRIIIKGDYYSFLIALENF